jgi:hypothetical protein
MSAGVELLLRLLDQDGVPLATPEDFEGALGQALRAARSLGLFGASPGVNPVPSCPLCGEGVPYRVGGRTVCNACRGVVEPADLAAWELDREAFLKWLAAGLKLNGPVRRVDDRLWQLGTLAAATGPRECFYRRDGPVSDSGSARLDAYRDVLVFHGTGRPARTGTGSWPAVSLLAILDATDGLAVRDTGPLPRAGWAVRFDAHSGVLWAGDERLGEVPVGGREYHFLVCLAARLDHFVAYADIKRDVLRATGSTDATEEATFCQGLKSRIKKKYVPGIDRVVATTNKADGYRLRGWMEG